MFDRRMFTRQAQFSEAEIGALEALRTQVLTTRYRFTDRELANLRFLRWLVRRPEWNRSLDRPAGAGVTT